MLEGTEIQGNISVRLNCYKPVTPKQDTAES